MTTGVKWGGMPPGHDAPSRSGEVERDTVEVMKRGEPHRDEERNRVQRPAW